MTYLVFLLITVLIAFGLFVWCAFRLQSDCDRQAEKQFQEFMKRRQ